MGNKSFGFGLFLIKFWFFFLDMFLKGITEIKFSEFEKNVRVVLIIKKVFQINEWFDTS